MTTVDKDIKMVIHLNCTYLVKHRNLKQTVQNGTCKPCETLFLY